MPVLEQRQEFDVLDKRSQRMCAHSTALVFGTTTSRRWDGRILTRLMGGKGMEQNAAMRERRSEPRTRSDEYHSAEFIFDEAELHYQYRIWDTGSSSMCVLIKENSEILRLLEVGKTLKVRYYSQKSPLPSEALTTVVRHVTRNDQGKFKGHFLVGLEIVQEG